jgi:hypothetical protein
MQDSLKDDYSEVKKLKSGLKIRLIHNGFSLKYLKYTTYEVARTEKRPTSWKLGKTNPQIRIFLSVMEK